MYSAKRLRTRCAYTASHSFAGFSELIFSNASHAFYVVASAVRARGVGVYTWGVSDRSQSCALLGTLMSWTTSPSPCPSEPDWGEGKAPRMYAFADSISRGEDAVHT